MSLSFDKDELSRIRHPADIALALRHLHRKPSDTEVAAAAECIRRHLDPKSDKITLESAREYVHKGKSIVTSNGLSIGHDDTIPQVPPAVKISLTPDAAPEIRALLESLRYDIS